MVDATNIFAKKYDILDKLGQGGFATVYLAKDTTLGRKVAIKVLDAKLSENDSAFLKRFEREAQIVAQLNHANIIDVYEFGQEKDQFFIVMPYLSGPDLSSLVKQQDMLTMEQVMRITEQVGSALDYAHSQNIVHRDVKPPNVILNEQGNALLTDFGIVKLQDETTALTQTGSILGTPCYMAPEQWTTGQTDSRTDLYALGVMVYLMLTGQVPFSGETPAHIMFAHLNETPLPPQALNPTLPSAVEKVLFKMLAKSPDQRYQTANQFCTALQTALTEHKVKDEEDKPKPRNPPKAIWFGGAILVVVLTIVGSALFFRGDALVISSATVVPFIHATIVEIDGQAMTEEFQKVACESSYRLEIKLLDSNKTLIEPSLFIYNWWFEPEDSTNENSLNSGSFARIYQAPCDLNNQMVTIEVKQGDKTLSVKNVNFDID